ncbi:MAG: class I SAM-dependent methyltransferase [Rhodospirillales bacterium]
MLEVALERAAMAGVTTAGFRQADAQTVRFDAPFDAAFSRFGVMFFADPIGAFTQHPHRPAPRRPPRLRMLAQAVGKPMDAGAAGGGVRASFPPLPPMDPTEPGPVRIRRRRSRAVHPAGGRLCRHRNHTV